MLISEMRHLWAKVSPKYVDDRGVGYDYNSIMHFSMTQGNREPGAVVLEPIKDKNARIGQRLKPSDSDIEQLKKMYKCNGGTFTLLLLKLWTVICVTHYTRCFR